MAGFSCSPEEVSNEAKILIITIFKFMLAKFYADNSLDSDNLFRHFYNPWLGIWHIFPCQRESTCDRD